jgi:two-component system response regulator YesN
MTIVIADDERLVRFSLREMLEDLDLPFSIVGEASNGKELISLVRKYKPDIAFVDIKMPIMSGLEAIEFCSNISESTQWIILTGFQDFEYAKKSIKLGVSDYLLKPASVEEVQHVLEPILLKNRKYINASNHEFEIKIAALLDDIISLPEDDPENYLQNARFSGSIFVFDCCKDEDFVAERKLHFCSELRKVIEDIIRSDFKIALFLLPSGKLASVAVFADENIQPVQKYLNRVERTVGIFSDERLSITEMRSDICKNFRELYDCLGRLQNLEFLRIAKPEARKVTLDQLKDAYKSMPKHMIDLYALVEEIVAFYHAKDYMNYVNHIDRMEKMFLSQPGLETKGVVECIRCFIARAVSCEVQSDPGLANWIRLFRRLADEILSDKHTNKSFQLSIIGRVEAYMDQHFSENLSIGQIASNFKVTPNYLSTLFHKKTGTTFVKYLMRLRMVKAKELLMSSCMHVCEVSASVGYESSRHFANLFKRYYGTYPSELLKKTRMEGEPRRELQ